MNWMLRLAAAFSPPEIHSATIKVYVDRLKDERPEHLEWAVDQAIDKCKHMPRISELLEFIKAKKIADIDEQRIEDQRKLLAEPRNEAPPKLMDLKKRSSKK